MFNWVDLVLCIEDQHLLILYWMCFENSSFFFMGEENQCFLT